MKPKTLEQRIAELEDEINGYVIQFNKALDEGNNEDKVLFAGLIKSARDNLDKLLAERQLLLQQQEQRHLQQAPPAGNSILYSHSHSSVY